MEKKWKITMVPNKNIIKIGIFLTLDREKNFEINK